MAAGTDGNGGENVYTDMIILCANIISNYAPMCSNYVEITLS